MVLVTIGTKGSTLTSKSVYLVANGFAQVAIEPSFHPSLDTGTTSSSSELFSFLLEDYLSREQSRAALLIMLNKLIISSALGITTELLYKIVAILNCDFGGSAIGEFKVNAVEFDTLNKSAASLIGIFILMDHQASSFSIILDVAAALGCEAIKANVTLLLDPIIADHEFSEDEEIAVASNCKILLNGSGHIGQNLVKSVAEIPRLHGSFRRVVGSINSMARIELNTNTKAGSANAIAAAVLPFIRILKILCENGTGRSRLIVKSLESTHEEILTKYGAQCPTLGGLKYLYETMSYCMFTWDTCRLLKEVSNLLERTIHIVRWEAVLAFLSLQGDSHRSEPEKVALGEGNAIILQHIRDTFPSDCFDLNEVILENLDPWNPKFYSFLEKIKETFK